VPVAVEGAAAKLLMPNTVRTVADILDLPAWPSEQPRLVAEVRIVGGYAERLPLAQAGPSGCRWNFLGGGGGAASPTSHSAASRYLAAKAQLICGDSLSPAFRMAVAGKSLSMAFGARQPRRSGFQNDQWQ
jgi:hypothetical protein